MNNDISHIINKHLIIKEKQKKERGEVFTPPLLIYNMLDQLPKSVWLNKNLKWLDPSNGVGFFPILIYYRLMNSLKSTIKKKQQRSKHILEKMLFMIELDSKNCVECKKIFNQIDPNSKINILTADFLNSSITSKYDIIIGNPPYQIKVGNSKSHRIWDKFVIKSVEINLKINGYLVMIHPGSWRDVKGNYRKVFNLLIARDLQYLTMRNYKAGREIFQGTATSYDYYCMKNTITDINKTHIDDIDKKKHYINLNNFQFIPGGEFKMFQKLVKGKQKVQILYNSSMYETRKPYISDTKNNIYKFPVIYTVLKKTIKFRYSSIKKGMFDIPKVIWSNGTSTRPIIDSYGKYGLTQFSYAIIDNSENLSYIQNAMNDKKFIKLMEYVRFRVNKYNYKIISCFSNDFWKYFNYK